MGKRASLLQRPLPPLVLRTGCQKFRRCPSEECGDGGERAGRKELSLQALLRRVGLRSEQGRRSRSFRSGHSPAPCGASQASGLSGAQLPALPGPAAAPPSGGCPAPSAPAASRGLAEPRAGALDAPDAQGPGRTCVGQLQAEGSAREDEKGCGEAEPASSWPRRRASAISFFRWTLQWEKSHKKSLWIMENECNRNMNVTHRYLCGIS